MRAGDMTVIFLVTFDTIIILWLIGVYVVFTHVSNGPVIILVVLGKHRVDTVLFWLRLCIEHYLVFLRGKWCEITLAFVEMHINQ
jgi:hypothetical protein